MHDLTRGSITGRLISMAVPIAIGMLFQTLYYLVDLYFVGRLGDAAIAGVGAAGNAQFIVIAMTQVLGVGTVALISQAVGRKDLADASLVFNQSVLLAAICAAVTLAGGYALAGPYTRALAANVASADAGVDYLRAFLPAMAGQFAMVTIGSALRGTGIAGPTMLVQMVTVLLNALFAPILITGWLTGKPLGVAGAGMASSLAVAVGVLVLCLYFARSRRAVSFDAALLRARPAVWARLLRIGLPPGGEFALMFVYTAVTYWVIRDFGPSAQAGFSVGSRVMQAVMLPAMAVAFAVVPVAGQSFGAGDPGRVRAAFRTAAWMGSGLMLALTLVCQWRPEWLVRGFTGDHAVIAVASEFLRIISWNFITSNLIFTCSGLLQAVGHTLPAFATSASRLITFVVPAVLLAGYPGFDLRHLWTLSVATLTLQALMSLWIARRELRHRLDARLASAP